MKKVVVFKKKEYDKILELIVEMESDIWDFNDYTDRSIIQEDLGRLKELLGFDKE